MTGPAVSLRDDARVMRALAGLDRERLAALLLEMTAVPSPTGDERALAELVVTYLQDHGIAAEVQSVDGRCANAVGRVGAASGARLLLYAPLDTAFSGDASEDDPFLGPDARPDFALPPRREGGTIIGLGAENPKGFAACAIAAVVALAQVASELPGEVVLGLVGGSMPVNRRPGHGQRTVGHGVGVRRLLALGPRPDAAIVLKPGYAVSHEEVGLAWFRITVRGAVGYTGIRHKGPQRNPVVAAARLVTALEAWFADYTAANSSGLVAPQGSVNAIRAGSPDRAAFIPERCEIDLDLRVAPDSSPDDVERQLRAALAVIVKSDGSLDLDVERTAALPGTRTDPGASVVRSLVRAWEAREGREHTPMGNASGASDAAILRAAGIPTGRIGLPPPEVPGPYSGFSMGVADIDAMMRLTQVLVMASIDAVSGTLVGAAQAAATTQGTEVG